MTLTELRYLLALHEQGHFAKAAETCHVTQSTLSAGIKHLEESLGVVLVERSRQFMRFTPTGEAVVEQAKDIIARSDDLLAMVKHQDPLVGELKIGMIYTIAPYLLPSLVHPWQTFAPHAPLRLIEGFTHELLEKLNLGQIDAAIIALPFTGTDNFTAWRLYQEAFTAVVPVNHSLAKLTSVSMDQLHHDALLILGSGHCFRDHALSAFQHLSHPQPAKQQQVQALIEGSSLETLRAMVSAGMGITLLPALAAAQPWPGLVNIPLNTPAPSREIVLLARPSFPRKSALRLLAQTIRDLSTTQASAML